MARAFAEIAFTSAVRDVQKKRGSAQAYDKFLAGKGVNFNELIGPVEDSVSGLDAAWGIRVKLS